MSTTMSKIQPPQPQPVSPSPAADKSLLGRLREMGFAGIYRRYGTILIFVGIFVLASLLNETFLTTGNLTNVLRQVVVVSLLAIGVTFIIVLGHIDVSLGSVVALTGVMAHKR